MPSVIDSPSGRLSEKVPRWYLTGTEACGGGKVFSWTPLMVMEYLGIYTMKNRVYRALRNPQGRGRALHPCHRLGTLLTWFSIPWVSSSPRKNIVKFHSVWTPFDIP